MRWQSHSLLWPQPERRPDQTQLLPGCLHHRIYSYSCPPAPSLGPTAEKRIDR